MPRREPQIDAGGIFCDVHALKKKKCLWCVLLVCGGFDLQESPRPRVTRPRI